MKELNQFELENVAGGAIPLALWAIYAGLAGAGFGGGVAVGLHSLDN